MAEFDERKRGDQPKKPIAPTRILNQGKVDSRSDDTEKLEMPNGPEILNSQLEQTSESEGFFDSNEDGMGGGNLFGSQLEKGDQPPSEPKSSGGPKTRVFNFKTPSATDASLPEEGSSQSDTLQNASEQPVTAWLVIIKGPGKGSALPVSYGMHNIGRDAGQQIPLDFGDEKISREKHAAVEYDPETRKFYLSKGSNLVYLKGNRVGTGAEQELNSGDDIKVGKTVLRFIPFCGPDFDWGESE